MDKTLKKDLLITPSIYTLFLYLLINEEWDKSDYVLHERIPISVHDNLEILGAEVYTDYLQGQNNTILTKLMQNVLYWKYLRYSRKVEYENVYGNDEFYLSMKYRNQGIKIIEDGPYYTDKQLLRSRQTKQNVGLLNYWFYWFWRKYIPFGFDKRVSIIYHTPFNHLPQEILLKGKTIDMQQLWDKKNQKEQYRIAKVFGLTQTEIEKLSHYKTLLITQDLPSSISEKEKLEMYKALLKENNIEQSSLLIKTHYAEKTKYREFFPQAGVIDTPVPAQLLDVMGYRAQKVVTISSSAVFAFVKPQTQIIFKGTEFDDRLKNFYGVIKLEDFLR